MASLRFADEVILVDKSSTDSTVKRAEKWADRIVTVPWSPNPGETYAYALSLCSYEWVVALADDECLNVRAIDFLVQEVKHPRADIYFLPREDYVLGRHDDNAYYWPEWHPQFHRRNSLAYGKKIHASAQFISSNQYRIPVDSGVAIVHLSHENVEQWIEKANRYTSQVDRFHSYADQSTPLGALSVPGADLRAFAHEAIDLWLSRSADAENDSYPVRVALLRSIYDIIDRVKELEENDHIDGRELFRLKCAELLAQYEAYYSSGVMPAELPTRLSAGDSESRIRKLAPWLTKAPRNEEIEGLKEQVWELERLRTEQASIAQDLGMECRRLTKQCVELEALRVAEFERADRAEREILRRHGEARLERENRDRERQSHERELENWQREHRKACELLEAGSVELEIWKREAMELRIAYEATRLEADSIQNSHSWRMTAPLRQMVSLFRRG